MKAPFNIDNVIKDMLAATKGEIVKDWKSVKETAENFMQARRLRLGNLATDRLAGYISDAELISFLGDEKLLLSSELAALKVIAKSVAQKVANAALDVLYAAINKLLPGVKK